MKKMLVLTISVFLFNCGYFGEKKNDPKDTIQSIDKLNKKADNYKLWAEKHEYSPGILEFSCDALLFVSFYQVSVGKYNIFAFEGDPGQWFRTPSKDCFTDGRSKTTISRDMFLGLFHLLWVNGDKAAIERIIEYGRGASPKWFMGDGLSLFWREMRTHLRPSILSSLFQMYFKMGGEDSLIRHSPFVHDTVTGYKLHLLVNHIYLRGLIFGGINDSELAALKEAIEYQPKNALYQAVYHHFLDGDQTEAIKLLLDDKYFPNDHLPTSSEYCVPYLFSTDYDVGEENSDWGPCPDRNQAYHGVDFLWAYNILINK